MSISVATLERWRAEALSRPARERAWTAAARFEAVLVTAALDDAARSAWCREHGVYPQQLEQWRQAATQALAGPEQARDSPGERKADPRRIKEIERELRRKEKALAETAALLCCQQTRGNLPTRQVRGRMMGLEDRQTMVRQHAQLVAHRGLHVQPRAR